VTDLAGGFVSASADFEVGGIIGVPEPGSFALLMLGLIGAVVVRRRPLFTDR